MSLTNPSTSGPSSAPVLLWKTEETSKCSIKPKPRLLVSRSTWSPSSKILPFYFSRWWWCRSQAARDWELKPPPSPTLASPAEGYGQCSSASDGDGESKNESFATRSLSIIPLCSHLTAQAWAILTHGLRHSCSSWVTLTAPSVRRNSEQCMLNLCNLKTARDSQHHSVQRSSQNLSSFLPCCKPECGEDKQMKKKKHSSLGPGYLSWDGINASKNSATYIHFKLKKEIFLERQNPE